MEPMSLGSPVNSTNNSPASTPVQYLPAFLMGEQPAPSTPRLTSMSPAKERELTFRTPRNTMIDRSNYQQLNDNDKMPNMKHSFGGPPIIDLYDDKPTNPTLSNMNHSVHLNRSNTAFGFNESSINQSEVYSPFASPIYTPNTSTMMYNNQSHVLNQSPYTYDSSYSHQLRNRDPVLSPVNKNKSLIQDRDFWVTIFGFPPDSASSVLEFFKRCGIISDVKMPPDCNWMNVSFSSRFECQEALLFNGKMFSPQIMLGVIPCRELQMPGKENLNISTDNQLHARIEKFKHMASPQAARVRALESSYRQAQERSNTNPESAPQNPGFVTRAMEYMFGW